MDITEYAALPSEEQIALWKEQLRRTVPRGAVKEVATAAGLSDWMLYKLRDEEHENYRPLHPKLPQIMSQTGRLDLLHFLAGLLNCAVFTVPPACQDHGDMNRAMTRFIKTSASYLEEVSGIIEQLDNGELYLDEAWERELREAEQSLARLQSVAGGMLHTLRLARGGIRVAKTGSDRDPATPVRCVK